MAYAPNATDQNAPQELIDPMKQLPATSTTGGGGAGGTPQGTTAVPNATKAPPVQDLKAYLAANAPQAVQMGQNIASNLSDQAGHVAGDINSAQQGVDTQVQGSSVAPNSDLVSRAALDPNAFVQNPTDVTAFQTQRDAAYTGPTTFEQTPEFTNANAEVQSATNAFPDVNKPGGVATLVRGQETNPTLGMQNLDELLLQGNPDAMAPIQGVAPQFAALAPQLSSAATAEDQAIQDAIAKTTAAKQGVQDTFLTGSNAVAPAFQSNLNKELQSDVSGVNSYNQGLQDLITQENGANPSYAALKNAVSAFDTANPGRNVELDDIVNPNAVAQPTLPQAATPQDIQTEKALELLLGGNYSPAFDASNAGSFKAPGTAPTLQDIYNPILQKTINSITGELSVPHTTGFTNADAVQKAINDLQKYLGENATQFQAENLVTPPQTNTGTISPNNSSVYTERPSLPGTVSTEPIVMPKPSPLTPNMPGPVGGGNQNFSQDQIDQMVTQRDSLIQKMSDPANSAIEDQLQQQEQALEDILNSWGSDAGGLHYVSS